MFMENVIGLIDTLHEDETLHVAMNDQLSSEM